MDEHPGFYCDVLFDGEVIQTHFFFEEGDFVRWYASKFPSEGLFSVHPEGTHLYS